MADHSATAVAPKWPDVISKTGGSFPIIKLPVEEIWYRAAVRPDRPLTYWSVSVGNVPGTCRSLDGGVECQLSFLTNANNRP
ncbi:MAG TPA: hypothetical protein PLI90_09225 [Rhodocyclaceae bacterium]|nr:hypothetical protein [Rhodocyclaceae bacterium]